LSRRKQWAKKKRRQQQPKEEPAVPNASGWDAITAAFEQLYPGQTNPLHVAAVPHPPLGGDGLIYGISAYRAENPPHWHLVTYGFSELYDKESSDPDVSGWGFELTLRLPRGAKEAQPPNWAFNFLMNLGKYVRRSRNPFGAGHCMNLNGPIALGTDTAIHAITFVTDPQVGTINTPNGRVEFLQVVGITLDEHAACGDWAPAQVLAILREADPLLLTDLNRPSILQDKVIAERIHAGIEQDGSSSDQAFVSVVDWSVAEGAAAHVTLGAKGVESLLPKLRSRLLHQRDFWLVGREKVVGLIPGGTNEWAPDENALVAHVTEPMVRAMLDTLKVARGTYQWPLLPGFTLEVVPSEIRDPDGKLLQVIG
jgi:hypothetical protein